jgi:hypothetical protein
MGGGPTIADGAKALRWRTRRVLRSVLPKPVKQGIKRGVAGAARPTHRFRLLPDVLIIGAKRAGTTSMFRYLMEHPAFSAPMLGKGVHYYDWYFDKGFDWYQGHFPTRLYGEYVRRRTGTRLVVGEGSPYYLFHPHAPHRIAESLPNAKLIVMLRDPVARAYSHHQYEVAWGHEDLPFEEAIEREPERLEGEFQRLLDEPLYNSFPHLHHSYLARGRYEEQLRVWLSLFPREQMLILESEKFYEDPQQVFDQALAFVGLPAFTLTSREQHNACRYPDLDDDVRRRLEEYYAEPNERLSELLGIEFGWRKAPEPSPA